MAFSIFLRRATEGLMKAWRARSARTAPVFSNFLLNLLRAFSMFSPSFTGTTIIMSYLSILLLYFLLQGECYIHSNQCAKLLILWRIHKLPLRLPAPPARKSPTLHLADVPSSRLSSFRVGRKKMMSLQFCHLSLDKLSIKCLNLSTLKS